jgi:hypothetical protein
VIKAYHGKPRKRRIIGNGLASAADMIGPIEHGCEIFGLTGGQFSFIDVMEHVLNQIGPAHCIVSTWTAAYANIEKAMRFCSDSRLFSCRWLIDRSFKTRKPELCKHLLDVFGKDAIRTASSHAKFMLLWNDNWTICIRTSMNLNENPRIEDFEISDDPDLLAYMRDLCESVFADDVDTEGFSTKNETEKMTKYMKQGDLWDGKMSLNTARISLNA